MIALLILSSLVPATAAHAPSVPVARQVAEPQTSGDQSRPGPVARFVFDGAIESSTATAVQVVATGRPSFANGLDGEALSLGPDEASTFVTLGPDLASFDSGNDFSVQFWLRTDAGADRHFVALSKKAFTDNSLASQKNAGWVFYVSGGTWAWSMGSGSRRITYERDNGTRMPVNDGRWHQLTMTYNRALSEIRLFYDGVNWVTYHVRDSDGFDFTSPEPTVVGWDGRDAESPTELLPAIEAGAQGLQDFVDAFNGFGLRELAPEDFVRAIVDPRRVFEQMVAEAAAQRGADEPAFVAALEAADWEPVSRAESALMSNPYTIHQAMEFMEAAPLMKIYSLLNGEVLISQEAAERFAERERLHEPDFDMDELAVWDRTLSAQEVMSSYSGHFEPGPAVVAENLSSLTAAAWNIWHGGKHFTLDEHGWDSRVAVADMLREEGVDVIMMQETYSSGDFIAAELGYYFATTVDWDYLNQGANISVLSRYPITEVHVQRDSPFQNVGTKVAISETQDLYVISNWYGMDQFPAVFDFHQSRFGQSDVVPTLFAGDFNAVPHTDGGSSPASVALLEAGFTDAFRSLYQDAEQYPGPSHRNGRRIDQLYYKGVGLSNTSTRVISTRASGFPSDHFLILSRFDLDYSTRAAGRPRPGP